MRPANNFSLVTTLVSVNKHELFLTSHVLKKGGKKTAALE